MPKKTDHLTVQCTCCEAVLTVHRETGEILFTEKPKKKSGVSFKDVYNHCKNDTQKELAKMAPVASVVLDTVADRIPSPKVAQEYRIRHIWHGDQDRNVPIANGRFLTAAIPGSVLHECPGEGHLLNFDHLDEILLTITKD